MITISLKLLQGERRDQREIRTPVKSVRIRSEVVSSDLGYKDGTVHWRQ